MRRVPEVEVCLSAVWVACQSCLAVPPCCRRIACLRQCAQDFWSDPAHAGTEKLHALSTICTAMMILQRQHLQRHGCRRHMRCRWGLVC
jgi:hypothetical protein